MAERWIERREIISGIEVVGSSNDGGVGRRLEKSTSKRLV